MSHGLRYCTGDTNLVRTATLAATNGVASQAFGEVDRVADGGGIVELTGTYTGASDALFDLEVTSINPPGAPTLSTPVYSGVGNGQLTGLTADSGIAAQEFSITVLDLGTPTRKAWAPFQAGFLRAKVAGTGGNDYSLRISQAGLTATATDYSLTAAISAGTAFYDGEQYDFGAVMLEQEGTVPETAPRLRFGDATEVYRHYKTFANGRYRYHLSPAPIRDIPIGTRVYAITGGRECVLYDVATPVETFENVTTLYSLLAQIQADSTLIEYDGVISQDRRPGGMACDDLTVQTASYVAASDREGTPYVEEMVLPLTVASDAPSEPLTITCVAAPYPGAEVWTKHGPISGDLTIVTGEAFSDGYHAGTIPTAIRPGTTPEGDKAWFLDLLPRAAGERVPVGCVKNFLLGSEARQEVYEFTWAPRPGADCDCTGTSVVGGPNANLLGIDPPEGGGVATLPAPLKSRIQTINDWRELQVASNASFAAWGDESLKTAVASAVQVNDPENYEVYSYVAALTKKVSAKLNADLADLDAVLFAANFFRDHLLQIHTDLGGGATALPSAVGTEFDTQFAAMVTRLSPLSGVSFGSDGWGRLVHNYVTELINHNGVGLGASLQELVTRYEAEAASGAQNFIADQTVIYKMLAPMVAKIYTAADLLDPFESAALTGNSVWSDKGGLAWFESANGLLPIQPGYGYHSCNMQDDGTGSGNQVPVSLRLFYIGLAIGCESSLKFGDKLFIKIGPYANQRSTYQEGDVLSYKIIRADPVALGGGQTGNDTITFTVIGTDAGALDNYELVTTAPTGYSDGGLSFSISTGGIPFVAGDQWTFSAEGGQFRWRKDGGSWTSTVSIAATVALSDGVSARFVAGSTPSWVVGDTCQLIAYAVNGVAQLASPDDSAFAWTSSTVIDITPSGAAECVLIAAHTIPSGSTITLTASDDNWSTTAYTLPLTWSAQTIAGLFASHSHAKWRLTINAAGSIGWLFLGTGHELLLENGIKSPGIWKPEFRPANDRRSRAMAGDISHSMVTYESFQELMTGLEYAAANDDGRLGVISPAGFSTFARIDINALPVPDLFDWQSASPSLSLTVQLEAA